jgi:nicotinate-nucleotide--dimethylbenzimidazole phosphoribosyltransferase
VIDLDRAAMDRAAARWATRAEPPGALGRIEEVAVLLAGITGRCPPPVPSSPQVVVFAADHGVVREGASAWPQDVTAAMVRTMAAGGAAVNALATVAGAGVTVVDVGVAADLGDLAGVVHCKVRPGTESLAAGPAMGVDDALAALAAGADLAASTVAAGGDLLVAGDMGIGNTTASSCLIGALTGRPAGDVVGPGAGLPPDGVARKTALVDAALRRATAVTDPVELLAEVGGLEIAAIAGFYVEAATRRIPVLVDGLIALAALLVADRLQAGTARRCLAGHRSTEPGATVALSCLGLEPLLDLRLRLGEGTGAVLAIPLVVAAALALNDMAALPRG